MLGHNQRGGIFLPNNKDKKVKKEEDSTMAALMRSTDEETEINSKFVRDVTESQRKSKRETVLKFEELLEK